MVKKTGWAVLTAAILLICVLFGSTVMADTGTAGTTGIGMENQTNMSGFEESHQAENQENHQISPYEDLPIYNNSTSVMAAATAGGQQQEKESGSVLQQTAQTSTVKNVPQTSDNETGTLAGAGMILLTLLAAVLAAARVRKDVFR